MRRLTAQEFVQKVLEGMEDLPPDFARRLAEAMKKAGVDRSQALRTLFEDAARE